MDATTQRWTLLNSGKVVVGLSCSRMPAIRASQRFEVTTEGKLKIRK